MLYTPPPAFVARLRRTFDNRLRIRWSMRQHAWLIEAKVARVVELEADSADDAAVQLRDGYKQVCEIRPGPRMDCPACGLPVPVPVRAFAETRCLHCAAKGRDGRVATGYWPLDDTLIDHLKKLDPQREWRRYEVAAMDVRNAQRRAQREAEALNDIDAVSRDHFNRLHQIPQFGYSGKTAAWVTA